MRNSGMATTIAKSAVIQEIDGDTFAIHDLFRELVASQTHDTRRSRRPTPRMGAPSSIGESGRRTAVTGRLGQRRGNPRCLARHAFNLLKPGSGPF